MKLLGLSLIAMGMMAGSAIAQAPATPSGPASPAPKAPVPPTRQEQEGKIKFSGGLPMETLTEEQRAKLREAGTRMAAEQAALYEKMKTLRASLDEMAKAEKIDEPAIRGKALEIGKIEGDLAMIRARRYTELRGILPKEKFEQLQNAPILEPQPRRPVPQTNSVPPVRPAGPPLQVAPPSTPQE